MNENKAIGQRIRKAREFRVLGTIECAELIGTDYTLLSRWEHGHTKPRPKSLKKIADVLNVDVNWLANGTKDFDKFINS